MSFCHRLMNFDNFVREELCKLHLEVQNEKKIFGNWFKEFGFKNLPST